MEYSLDDFTSKQRQHYATYSLKRLLELIGFEMESTKFVYENLYLEDVCVLAPTARVAAVDLSTGIISHPKFLPRYNITKEERALLDISIQQCTDIEVRFSITGSGLTFYSPCWVSFIADNQRYDLPQRTEDRLDWDKNTIRYLEHNKRRFVSFGAAVATQSSFTMAVCEFLKDYLLSSRSVDDDNDCF